MGGGGGASPKIFNALYVFGSKTGSISKMDFIILEACNFQTHIVNCTVKISYKEQFSSFLPTIITQHHKCGLSNSHTVLGGNTGLGWSSSFISSHTTLLTNSYRIWSLCVHVKGSILHHILFSRDKLLQVHFTQNFSYVTTLLNPINTTVVL